MTGVVIDIGTGREIHDSELSEHREGGSMPYKPVMEISAPDGRTVFSIRRLLGDSKDNESSKSIAA